MFYVTAIDSGAGGRYYVMSGPYKTHDAALADVEKCRDIAYQHDGRAWFMAWGTARIVDRGAKGRLNLAGLVKL